MMIDFGVFLSKKEYVGNNAKMNALAVFDRNVLNPNFHQLGGDRRTDKISKHR